MDAEKANYEVTRMARLLGVTRQGYYAWRKQRQTGPGPRAQRRTEIDQAVRNAFHASDEVYGAPRIARELAAAGVAVDRKTVAASMRRQGRSEERRVGKEGRARREGERWKEKNRCVEKVDSAEAER